MTGTAIGAGRGDANCASNGACSRRNPTAGSGSWRGWEWTYVVVTVTVTGVELPGSVKVIWSLAPGVRVGVVPNSNVVVLPAGSRTEGVHVAVVAVDPTGHVNGAPAPWPASALSFAPGAR